ncbi:MAG: hypothetical protein H7269_01490 [Cellulomonas sp.]|nr:hypothetical protein [Cellulomonas sp.]
MVPSNGATCHPASELQNLMLVTDVVESFLQEIATSAASARGRAISTSVTTSCEGRPVTVASSDAHAAQFDEVQCNQFEGPCLTAVLCDADADSLELDIKPLVRAAQILSEVSIPPGSGGRPAQN